MMHKSFLSNRIELTKENLKKNNIPKKNKNTFYFLHHSCDRKNKANLEFFFFLKPKNKLVLVKKIDKLLIKDSRTKNIFREQDDWDLQDQKIKNLLIQKKTFDDSNKILKDYLKDIKNDFLVLNKKNEELKKKLDKIDELSNFTKNLKIKK